MMTRLLSIVLLLAATAIAAASPTPPNDRMAIGVNFWNLGWHKPDDCFANVKAVSGDDPWNPQFLKDIAFYRCLRFMDWNQTNNSRRSRWSERPLKSAAVQNPAAYEWMIDLCNRTDADLWITVPHLTVSRETGDAPADYALRLCLLVKTGVDMKEVDLRPMFDKLSTMTADQLVAAGGARTTDPLKPSRRLYLEYSNETWNGIFKQSAYCAEQGEALQLAANKRDAGLRFHAWAALRLHRAADLVFGAGGPRVVRVIATQSANSGIAAQHQAVLKDPKLNPWPVKVDAIAIAPYFGNKIDGAAPDVVQQLRAAIEKSAGDVKKHKTIADAAGLRLIAYEGGQHVVTHAATINKDPAMADLYREYLAAVAPNLDLFVHYAHVGRAGDRGCWGALEYTGQPAGEAPKYRALREWATTKP